MYGLVLMAALSSGGTSPGSDATPMAVAPVVAGCFGSSYAVGCTGYSVGCFGSCTGYTVGCTGCTGCTGYSLGCYGSCTGRVVLFPRLRARLSSFLGCRGSACYGSSCYGSSCYGSSCFGSSCFGSSCFGSSCFGTACYGSSCFGTATYYGSDFTGSAPIVGGCGGMIVGSAYTPSNTVVVGAPALEFQAAQSTPQAAPARLTIELPEDAQLFVDGQATKGTGKSRNFHTPDLNQDRTYFYDLKAIITVEGQEIVEEKRVIVRAGEAVNEAFPKLIAAKANPAAFVSARK